MARIIDLMTISGADGDLSVLEPPLLPIAIRRVFCIYNNSLNTVRGQHRHRKCSHILICASGSCKLAIDNGVEQMIFWLNSREKALLLDPWDWREISDFSDDCVLFCLSDEVFDPADYIYTPYLTNSSPTLRALLETNAIKV